MLVHIINTRVSGHMRLAATVDHSSWVLYKRCTHLKIKLQYTEIAAVAANL